MYRMPSPEGECIYMPYSPSAYVLIIVIASIPGIWAVLYFQEFDKAIFYDAK